MTPSFFLSQVTERLKIYSPIDNLYLFFRDPGKVFRNRFTDFTIESKGFSFHGESETVSSTLWHEYLGRDLRDPVESNLAEESEVICRKKEKIY